MTRQSQEERGQTLYDYLLGTVLVILTIGAAIGLLGSAYDPFFDPVDTQDQTLANSVSDELIHSNQTIQGENMVEFEALNNTLQDEQAFQELRERAGVPTFRSVNVTVTDTAGEQVASGGDHQEAVAEARSVRMIRSVEGVCDSGCELVIRVW